MLTHGQQKGPSVFKADSKVCALLTSRYHTSHHEQCSAEGMFLHKAAGKHVLVQQKG